MSAMRTDWSDTDKRAALQREATAKPAEDPAVARRRRAELDAADDARIRAELRARVEGQTPPGDPKAAVGSFLENFGR